MEIRDRVVLVTGAGSGLGGAVARMVVEGGGKVVLLDVNAEAGTTLAAELGAVALFQRTDVTSDAIATATARADEAIKAAAQALELDELRAENAALLADVARLKAENAALKAELTAALMPKAKAKAPKLAAAA